MDPVIGTAGWSIALGSARDFPEEGTSLERYSRVFGGVEINSSFHRSHRTSTWEKWAASVPNAFQFAVKIPKSITHQAKLVDAEDLVRNFADEVAPLGDKLAVLLVQTPPRLAFDASVATRFFAEMKRRFHANIVCEPRHASWFEPAADALLNKLFVARAAADPALGPEARIVGGWPGLAYWRLHGSPVMYRSSYSEDRLDLYAAEILAAKASGRIAWCMFDNTASSEATGNALSLLRRLKKAAPR